MTNNVETLLIVDFFGLLAAAAGLGYTRFVLQQMNQPKDWSGAWTVGIVAAIAIWGGVTIWFLWDPDWFAFGNNAHYVSAVSLFVLIAAVVVLKAEQTNDNDLKRRSDEGRPAYFLRRGRAQVRALLPPSSAYGWIAAAMILSLIAVGSFYVLGLLDVVKDFQDWLFWLEALMILWFVVFWVYQSIKLWNPTAK